MISYSKITIYIITIVISTIIFVLLNFLINSINQIDFNNIFNNSNQNQEQNNQILENEKIETNNLNQKEEKLEWIIEIPSILLKAEIAEGTNKEVMDKYVGHFEETSKISGNVGLAAHNRGYPVNYFENIRKLKIGDEIIYTYKKNIKKYKVNKIEIIKDTNWNYLKENQKENLITLITCIENEPEYRRCIQGIEERIVE